MEFVLWSEKQFLMCKVSPKVPVVGIADSIASFFPLLSSLFLLFFCMVWSVSWIRGSHQQYPKGLIVFPDVAKKRSDKIFSDAFRLSADLLDILCGSGKNLILCFGQHFPRFGIVCVNGGTVQ